MHPDSSPRRYNVIYADPPWSYDVKKTGNGFGSAAAQKYHTLSLEELCALPVPELAAADAALFLWATTPLMPQAFKVVEAWGFSYRTMLTWHKRPRPGLGYYLRGVTEHLLIAVRGTVKAFRLQDPNLHESEYDLEPGQLFAHNVGRHSQKPHYVSELVNRAAVAGFPGIVPAKLELFARTREGMFGDYEYEGWDVYGNQVNNSINLPLDGDKNN